MTYRRLIPILAAGAALLSAAPAAMATHTQPPLDITKLKYDPIGHFKPGDAIPPDYGKSCDTVTAAAQGRRLQPVRQVERFRQHDLRVLLPAVPQPGRHERQRPARQRRRGRVRLLRRPRSDRSARAGRPRGRGHVPEPPARVHRVLQDDDAGGPQGLRLRPSTGTTSSIPRPTRRRAVGHNPAIVVAGADHPDEHILIGSHYDQTDDRPRVACGTRRRATRR